MKKKKENQSSEKKKDLKRKIQQNHLALSFSREISDIFAE
jgi:hypothetical protein